jgi:nucleotide sugar dehydrogenase
MKISIVGFGYIGAVIGAVLADSGNIVNAIDNNKSNIDDLNLGVCNIPEPALSELIAKGVSAGAIRGYTDYGVVGDSDVILVTVGTPLSSDFDADLSAIRDVFLNLSRHAKAGQIIMVKSTVPPGVTRKMAQEFFGDRDDIYFGFSPERLAEGDAITEFRSLPIIVGGVNQASSDRCAAFWENTLDVDVIQVSSCEAAEMVKLANNQWIDLNVALANEFAKLCDSLPFDLDVLEIIKGANSLKKGQHFVNILTPSIGVGGYCLTKDPWFLSALGERHGSPVRLPRVGRDVNDSMPEYSARRINAFFQSRNVDLSSTKIAILGYSFKTNSGDVRFSPIEKFVEILFREGYKNISVFDSSISDSSIKDSRVIRESLWESCVMDADCVVFGAAHDDIKALSVQDITNLMQPSGIVYDGRRYFSHTEIAEFKNSGVVYQGIGRSFNEHIQGKFND